MNKLRLKLAIKLLSAWFLIMLVAACIEEFETESISFEKLLVVNANISDQSKNHVVNLSFTTPITGELADEPSPVTGAIVWIEDNLGNRIDYVEQNEGTYHSPDNFAGIPGRSYALFIRTNDGKNYQSSFEELVPAPEISEIYNRFKVETGDGEVTSIPGVQFFIDSENAGQSTQFYRFEWVETHQVIVPHIKKWDWVLNEDGTYAMVPFSEDVKECYREIRPKELVLANSTTNQNGQLSEVPITFIQATDFEVTTQFRLEITQRALSAEAYSYYRKIEIQNESNGTLFDKQQGEIVGNIESIDNPAETVLGYFEVSGASSKRVFMDHTELDEPVIEYITRPCTEYRTYMYEGSVWDFYQALDLPEDNRNSVIGLRSQYELYDYDDFGPNARVIYMAHRLCVDCRYRGSLEKPDYWP